MLVAMLPVSLTQGSKESLSSPDLVMAGRILCVYRHFIWIKHQTRKKKSFCRELVIPFWLPVLLVRGQSAPVNLDGALSQFRLSYLGEALLSVTSANLLTSNFCLEKGKALCCNVFCWRSKCSAGYLKEAFFSPKKWVQKFWLSCPWQLCHCWMPFFIGSCY